MTRSRSQMTLDAWDADQTQIGDHDTSTAPEPRTLRDGLTSAVTPAGLDDDTIPAVAPRGALDVLRQLEAAA